MQGAHQVGLVLKERSAQEMIIHNEITGRDDRYEILKEFPFDSDRKRMTLIVKHNNEYLLLSKGADSIMLSRIDQRSQSQLPFVNRQLNKFALDGLRTLVVA